MPKTEIIEYITQLEFCRRLGIERSTLRNAILNGRVILENRNKQGYKMINYYPNRESFIKTAKDPRRFTIDKNDSEELKKLIGSKEANTIKGRSIDNSFSFVKSKHDIDTIQDPEDKDKDFRSNMNRVEAESIKQIYLARQAKLKFLKEAETLIEIEEVKKEWEDIALRVQKAILSIPSRVSEIFASIQNANEINKTLTNELRIALSNLNYRVDYDKTKRKKEKKD